VGQSQILAAEMARFCLSFNRFSAMFVPSHLALWSFWLLVVVTARGMQAIRTFFRVCHRDSFNTEEVLADVPC
jgi:hypothetical protein